MFTHIHIPVLVSVKGEFILPPDPTSVEEMKRCMHPYSAAGIMHGDCLFVARAGSYCLGSCILFISLSNLLMYVLQEEYPRLPPSWMSLDIPSKFPSFRTDSTSTRIEYTVKLMKRVWLLMGIIADQSSDPRHRLNLEGLAYRIKIWSGACILLNFCRQCRNLR